MLMTNYKLKILLSGLFILSFNSNGNSAIHDNYIADVIPFESISHDMNALPNTGPQTPTVTSTSPNPTQSPAATQNNVQLNPTSGSGLGTSSNSANKTEQNDLYNRSVNNMLNGK